MSESIFLQSLLIEFEILIFHVDEVVKLVPHQFFPPQSLFFLFFQLVTQPPQFLHLLPYVLAILHLQLQLVVFLLKAIILYLFPFIDEFQGFHFVHQSHDIFLFFLEFGFEVVVIDEFIQTHLIVMKNPLIQIMIFPHHRFHVLVLYSKFLLGGVQTVNGILAVGEYYLQLLKLSFHLGIGLFEFFIFVSELLIFFGDFVDLALIHALNADFFIEGCLEFRLQSGHSFLISHQQIDMLLFLPDFQIFLFKFFLIFFHLR